MQPFVIAILLSIWAVLATANANAQQTAPSMPQHQAPIGHRQPKMSDLPPDLAKKEQSGAPAQKTDHAGDGESTSGQGQDNKNPIGPGLNICRNC